MENYVPNGNVKIWTEIKENKNKKFVILCNGGPGCCDYLLPVSQMIEDEYNVIRFEQRGCGRSDKNGNYSIAETISDLEQIRKFYSIDKWIIGGHSWGANLSLIYTISYPENVENLLYIAGNGVQRNREWSIEYHKNKEKYGEIMPEMTFPENFEVNRIGNRSFQEYIQKPSLYKNISEIKTSALFICAEKDIRQNWPAEQIQQLIKNSVLVVIQNAKHYIWLTEYNKMRDELRKYLKLDKK
jgi:proline iminopeptidase